MVDAAIDPATTGPLIALIALGGPALTYLTLRRKSSGRIGATEAETLWAEAEKMRAIYREEVVTLRIDALAQREVVLGLLSQVKTLHEDVAMWQAKATEVLDERGV